MATILWLLSFTSLSFRLTFRLLFPSPPPSYLLLTSLHLSNSFLIPQTPHCLLPSRAMHSQQQSGTLLSDRIFEEEEDEEFKEEEDGDDGSQKEEEKASTISPTAAQSLNDYRSGGTPSVLTIKEKELASYAHLLGKKLKCQQLKVHSSCPGELVDVIRQLEVATGSAAVGQIGRTFILYRPSISKLKAADKKRQKQCGQEKMQLKIRALVRGEQRDILHSIPRMKGLVGSQFIADIGYRY